MEFTAEQKAVMETNSDLVINAVAGSGKTTTLLEYACTRPSNSRILYLAFNKTVKEEAKKKFEAAGLGNVTVETAHSLAYNHIVRFSRYQVTQTIKSHELCSWAGIKTGDRHADLIVANHVNRFISYFCNSRVAKVTALNYSDVVSDPKAKKFVENFYSLIEKITRETLAKMDRGEIPLIHDFYLKKFQLSHPTLHYDYILFDEGQDASAAMLDVFLNQRATKIIVGDMHQQIYGWRYAINSLQQVDFPVYHLSNSFRFDEEIALVANKILGWKNHFHEKPAVKITGAGQPSAFIQTRATLGRTNLALLLNAITLHQSAAISKVHFEGNINSYTFADEGASLYDVLNLYNGRTDTIKDKLIAEMKSMRDLEDYIEKTEDNSLSLIVDVVKEYGNALPQLISELKKNHTEKKEEADMIFSTVHRCKGMEYDEVTLMKDFITESKLVKNIASTGPEKMLPLEKNKLLEEINILYTAATRAKSRLNIPESINPLQSVNVVKGPEINITKRKYPSFDRWVDYEPAYIKPFTREKEPGSKNNRGKKWDNEDETTLKKMVEEGKAIRTIARALGRGEHGVRMKMLEMGLGDN